MELFKIKRSHVAIYNSSSFANSFSNVVLETAKKMAQSIRRLLQFTSNLTRGLIFPV